MRIKVVLPTDVFLDEETTKVVAEATDGSFCLLPRHIDLVAPLVPGILIYDTRDGEERLLAVDEGILVKCAALVLVSTRRAVRGYNLGELKDTVLREFGELDERERKVRSSLARLEANFIRSIMELRGHG